MRIGGAALFLIGLVAAIVCTMSGCGAFFSWNGRHAIKSFDLAPGPGHYTFGTFPGRRYTIAVRVGFDPATVEEKNGMAAVEAKMPIVLRATDPAGTRVAELNGWIDPAEPPNVFYSTPLHEPQPGGPHEIAVERLLAPFAASSDDNVDVNVDLGDDRVGKTKILGRTLLVFDDALPGSIRNAAIGAVVSAIAMLVGLGILVSGWWRTRGKRKRRRTAIV